MILEDDIVKLVPVRIKDELEYALDLIMKCGYTRISREEAKQVLIGTIGMFWNCYDKKTGIKGGLAYLTKINECWMLDAYKDDALMKSIDNAMDYSYRVGKLVTDYAMTFTDRLMTCHAFINRGATIVCKKLGFKEDFIVLKKEKTYGN